MRSGHLLSTLVLVAVAFAAPAPQSDTSSTEAASTSTAAASSASSSAAVSSSSEAVPTSAPSATASQDPDIPLTTAGFADTEPNAPIFSQVVDPEDMVGQPNPDAIRGSLGAPILGPQNVALQFESPDFLAPPSTDSGSIGNAKWPMAMSHNRIQTGGWARQQNKNVMPLATELAGVNMRLQAGAVRELHWHTTAEWAYVLSGTVRISSVNSDNQNWIADVEEGDLWYFPAGMPHALQALNGTDNQGAEFILVFDDGDFSEDSTLQLTDWLAHIPHEVLVKNFDANPNAFDHIPEEELYIFPAGSVPSLDEAKIEAPNGETTNPFSFAMSKMEATKVQGGTVKIVDSTTFKASITIAAVEVTVEPGAMRELHWHPTQPEWSFFIKGQARMTLFAGSGNARTFDYSPGDVGYVPPSFGHYVENVGNETLEFLEIFKSDRFQDISLNQWLALTPTKLVKQHLNLDDDTISKLSKNKGVVVANPNL